MESKNSMTDSPETSKPPPPAATPKKSFPLKFRLSYIFFIILIVWIVSVFSNSKLLPTGSNAPPWTLRNVSNNGGMMSLSSLKGKTVVLDFWGIGCPPCIQEIFELEAVWKDLKDQEVMVLGVTAWGENRADVLRLRKAKGITYPMLLGTSDMISAYKVDSLPTLYIIDPEGKIVAAHQGFWDRESLKKAVLKAAGK